MMLTYTPSCCTKDDVLVMSAVKPWYIICEMLQEFCIG